MPTITLKGTVVGLSRAGTITMVEVEVEVENRTELVGGVVRPQTMRTILPVPRVYESKYLPGADVRLAFASDEG